MIIKELAEIQIQAFELLKKDSTLLEDKDLSMLLRVKVGALTHYHINKKIRIWKSIQNNPELLRQISSEYQWGICVHILYTMEEEWVQDNADGVIQLWELLDNIYKKFHPEIKLLWLQQSPKESARSCPAFFKSPLKK